MEASDDLFCIYRTNDSIETDLIKTELEARGLPCFLITDNAGGVLPHLTMTTGIQIMIHKEDRIIASEIIKNRLERRDDI